MDKLAFGSDFHKNIETSALFLRDMKECNVLVNPSAPEKKAAMEDKKAQEQLYNAKGICMQELAWGRVIQKGKVSSEQEMMISRMDGKKMDRNVAPNTGNTLMCAFAEIPTAVELFQKARNMDWRNVEERTFATSSRIVDFTV